MTTTALYYPTIQAPEKWLRHALLLHDRVATVVTPKQLQKPTGRNATLQQLDLWEGVTSEEILYDWRYMAEAKHTISAFAQKTERTTNKPVKLYLEKLGHEVEQQLQDDNLLSGQPLKKDAHGNYWWLDPALADMLISIAARRLAEAAPGRYLTSTDQAAAVQFAYDPVGGSEDLGEDGVAVRIHLSDGMPRFADHLTWEEIRTFREENAGALAEVRAAWSKVQALSWHDPDQAAHPEYALADFEEALATCNAITVETNRDSGQSALTTTGGVLLVAAIGLATGSTLPAVLAGFANHFILGAIDHQAIRGSVAQLGRLLTHKVGR